jgi:hypothetical protein
MHLSTTRHWGRFPTFYFQTGCLYDKNVQYVDDTSQFLNLLGATEKKSSNQDQDQMEQSLLSFATQNSTIWAECMWILGGYLNLDKCFYYASRPYMVYEKRITSYSTLSLPGDIKVKKLSTKRVHSLP